MELASNRWFHGYSRLPERRPVAVAIAIVASLALGIASAVAPAAAKAPGGGELGGLTSQGLPSYVETSNSGRKIDVAVLTIAAHCSNGGALIFPQVWQSVPIAGNGVFKATDSDSSVEEGMSVEISETFSGRFNRERTAAVTKARTVVTFHNPDGSMLQCDSRNVNLRARD